MKQIISGQIYGAERALYHLCDASVVDCAFEGAEDGESALKESRNVQIENCRFALRYPLWHCEGFRMMSTTMSETVRAPIWYAKDGELVDCTLRGVKAVRECCNIAIRNCDIVSAEFGWKCRNITVLHSAITAEYCMLELQGGNMREMDLHGKYSFQYAKDVEIVDSRMDTKDAFWHSKNVTVRNCRINGEYLGWYSDGLTLIDCEIIGTQPLCYCTNLTLANCKMTDVDLSFEYSDVQAEIVGDVLSVKNPKSGRIVADGYGEIILRDSVYPTECEIVVRDSAK